MNRTTCLSGCLMLGLWVSHPSHADPPPSATPTPSPSPTEAPRRTMPSPLDGAFPFQEFPGPTVSIGVPDSPPSMPLMDSVYAGPGGSSIKQSGVRWYGWLEPAAIFSSSSHSTFPDSNDVAPGLQLQELMFRVERPVDTVQTDHFDWGFRFTTIGGVDYRYSVAVGLLSEQFHGTNALYGADPVDMYGMFYFPKVAQGLVVMAGRFPSPVDIENATAPDNYLFSHSLLYTSDPTTQMGIKGTFMLSKQWSVDIGIVGGDDVSAFNPAAHPTLTLLGRWVSPTNKDSVYGGIVSLNQSATFTDNADNLQYLAATWTHVFTPKVHMMTEVGYEYEYNGFPGGSITNGPIGFGTGGNTPAEIHGLSTAMGVLNTLEFKLSDSSYLSFRNEYFNDPRGFRFGFATPYTANTLGISKSFSPTLTVRPEIRYDRAYGTNVRPFDNGSRADQFTFGMDCIQRF